MSVIVVGGFALAGIAAFSTIMKSSSHYSQALSARAGFQRLEEKLRSAIKDPAVLRVSMGLTNARNREFSRCITLLMQDPDPKNPDKQPLPVTANCLAGAPRKPIFIQNTLGENISAEFNPNLQSRSSNTKYSPDAQICDGQLISDVLTGTATTAQKKKLESTDRMCRFSTETDYEFRCYKEDYLGNQPTCKKPPVVRVHYWLKDNPPLTLRAGTRQRLFPSLTDNLPLLPGNIRAKVGFVDVAVREIVNGGIQCGPNETLKKIDSNGMPVCNPPVVGANQFASTGNQVLNFGTTPKTLISNSVRVEDNQQVLIAVNYRVPCPFLHAPGINKNLVNASSCHYDYFFRERVKLELDNVSGTTCYIGSTPDTKKGNVPVECSFTQKTINPSFNQPELAKYVEWKQNITNSGGEVHLLRNGQIFMRNIGPAIPVHGKDVVTKILYDTPDPGTYVYSIQFTAKVINSLSLSPLYVSDLSLNLLALPKE
jgi:hypothetical protein